MNKEQEFVICVSNDGYEDLEIWKVYQILADSKAAEVGCFRVLDESGEDYLYPIDCFVAVNLPGNAKEKLLASVDNGD